MKIFKLKNLNKNKRDKTIIGQYLAYVSETQEHVTDGFCDTHVIRFTGSKDGLNKLSLLA